MDLWLPQCQCHLTSYNIMNMTSVPSRPVILTVTVTFPPTIGIQSTLPQTAPSSIVAVAAIAKSVVIENKKYLNHSMGIQQGCN